MQNDLLVRVGIAPSEFGKPACDRKCLVAGNIGIIKDTDGVVTFNKSPGRRDQGEPRSYCPDGQALAPFKFSPNESGRHDDGQTCYVIADENLIMNRLQFLSRDDLLVE